MKILAERGANIYQTNNYKINALHLAVYRNHINVVRLLLNSNYDVTRETIEGQTALHLAAQLKRIEIANLMISFISEGYFKRNYSKIVISKINTITNMSPLSEAILNQCKPIAIKLI